MPPALAGERETLAIISQGNTIMLVNTNVEEPAGTMMCAPVWAKQDIVITNQNVCLYWYDDVVTDEYNLD